MAKKNYRNHFIIISFLVLVTIWGSIPTKCLAETNSLKGCDNTEEEDNSNVLKELPGYPSQNPEKTLYHIPPFRASAGAFIIITKDDKLCHINDGQKPSDKARALKKFSEQYSGSKPLRECRIFGWFDKIADCKRR